MFRQLKILLLSFKEKGCGVLLRYGHRRDPRWLAAPLAGVYDNPTPVTIANSISSLPLWVGLRQYCRFIDRSETARVIQSHDDEIDTGVRISVANIVGSTTRSRHVFETGTADSSPAGEFDPPEFECPKVGELAFRPNAYLTTQTSIKAKQYVRSY